MSLDIRGITDCCLVGEFVEKGEVPAGMKYGCTETVPTRLVASFIDYGRADVALREFRVLLNDGRVAVVRGHTLKRLPAAEPGDSESYEILVGETGREELVSFFKASDVAGIFVVELERIGRLRRVETLSRGASESC